MKTKLSGDRDTRITVSTLLGSIAVAFGATMLLGACFMDENEFGRSLFLGLGVALFPAGIFT
ncbi:MAG: hypothetical protein JSW27_09010, partial [Phycisphaerales bacterium]